MSSGGDGGEPPGHEESDEQMSLQDEQQAPEDTRARSTGRAEVGKELRGRKPMAEVARLEQPKPREGSTPSDV